MTASFKHVYIPPPLLRFVLYCAVLISVLLLGVFSTPRLVSVPRSHLPTKPSGACEYRGGVYSDNAVVLVDVGKRIVCVHRVWKSYDPKGEIGDGSRH